MKRKVTITLAQKQAIIDNLQLESQSLQVLSRVITKARRSYGKGEEASSTICAACARTAIATGDAR